ncbi:MAG: helix-turn-helix domain-containing protein [Candidatus Aenigmarchaeota archaeon]|nr:helix-turn-helix domain-containing protein [bacterium]NIO20872.1 helix-turn-helix domain-containing protein [Candidatus Aenigmarchaeota archaeon]
MSEQFGPGKLLRLKEAAQLLGLSERWVWSRVADGSLPVIKLKGATRVTLTDLEKFVESGRGINGEAITQPHSPQ